MGSIVWNFFIRPSSEDDFVKCVRCDKSLKFYNSTSNLLAHMKSKHYDEYKRLRKMRDSSDKRLTSDKKSESLGDSQNSMVSRDNLLARFICTSGSAFRLSENNEFRDFVASFGSEWTPPSANTVKRYIENENDKFVRMLRADLKDKKDFTIVTDGYSDRKKDYSFYSAHLYCIEKSFERKHFFIGIKSTEGSCTVSTISSSLIQLLDKVGIRLSDCLAATTDGARVLSSLSSTHRLFHFHCGCHVANLIFEEFSKIPKVKRMLNKAKNVASYIRAHRIDREEMIQKSRLLRTGEPLPVPLSPTRWASVFLLFKRYYANISSFGAFVEVQPFMLTPAEQPLMKECVELLTPLYNVMKQMESNDSWASDVLPHFLGVKDEVSEFGTVLGRKLVKIIEKRISDYQDNDFVLILSVLDPRIAFVPGLLGKRSWKDAEELLLNRFQQDAPSKPVLSNPSTSDDDHGLIRFLQKQLGPSAGQNATVEEEIINYRALLNSNRPTFSSDPLSFWKTNEKKLPFLAGLSKKVLAAPASSAESERLFRINYWKVNAENGAESSESCETLVSVEDEDDAVDRIENEDDDMTIADED
ncbi:hypothetical protein CRE_17480 [Caenorhabditis remanei]|uniref:BED-type domain-containing protein n=1 Tax=Caenorhabditis remanei TaxID=31234 RepID=E3N7U0_CAERE|nr:hypothetical protein CRE_17480 [Caenorhabditis remanei]